MKEKGSSKGTLLVVDDEPAVILILSEFLAREGFRVQTASSGARALEKVKESKPDMVLLDIAMPEMDGMETLRRLKALDPKLPVMMITAYRDGEKIVETFRLGAFDCLFKPFDFQYLRTAILGQLLR